MMFAFICFKNHWQVAVLVEVKARFDEVRNMGFAQMLEVK
jgi:polyphosphate kinase